MVKAFTLDDMLKYAVSALYNDTTSAETMP